MRTKRQYRSDSKEAFKAFKQDNPDIDIDSDTWRKILLETNRTYRDYILETGEEVKLPFGFGCITINKTKNKKVYVDKDGNKKIVLPVDWVKSKLKGKRVYITNDHTDGYRFGWVYKPQLSRLPFRNFWRFNAGRAASRLLGQYIKKPDSNYQYIYTEWIR